MARSSLPGGCRPRSRAPGSLDTSDYADSVFGSTRGSVSDFNDDSVFRSESQSSDPDDSWSFYNSRTPLQSDESPQGAPAGTSTPIVKSSLPPRRLFPSTPLPPSPGIPETPKIVRDHFEGCKVKRITPDRDERPWHMAPGVADTFLKSDNIWKLDSSTFDPFLRSNITTAVMFYKQSVNYEPKYKLAKKKFIRNCVDTSQQPKLEMENLENFSEILSQSNFPIILPGSETIPLTQLQPSKKPELPSKSKLTPSVPSFGIIPKDGFGFPPRGAFADGSKPQIPKEKKSLSSRSFAGSAMMKNSLLASKSSLAISSAPSLRSTRTEQHASQPYPKLELQDRVPPGRTLSAVDVTPHVLKGRRRSAPTLKSDFTTALMNNSVYQKILENKLRFPPRRKLPLQGGLSPAPLTFEKESDKKMAAAHSLELSVAAGLSREYQRRSSTKPIRQGVMDKFVRSRLIWKLESRNFQEFLQRNVLSLVMFYDSSQNYSNLRSTYSRDKFVQAAEFPQQGIDTFAAVDCSQEKGICEAQEASVRKSPIFCLYSGDKKIGDVRDPNKFVQVRCASLVDA